VTAPLSTDERNPDDDRVCFYCGYPDCRCADIADAEPDYSCCEHGVGFDEDCEDCDAEDYEETMARFGDLGP
jgi:hypothetical protein